MEIAFCFVLSFKYVYPFDCFLHDLDFLLMHHMELKLIQLKVEKLIIFYETFLADYFKFVCISS